MVNDPNANEDLTEGKEMIEFFHDDNDIEEKRNEEKDGRSEHSEVNTGDTFG